MTNNTLKTKEAAKYLGIAEHRLRLLTKQGKIKHFTAGNKYLYKRISLDQWLDEVQESSIKKSSEKDDYGKIRKVRD
jgi:excisionase family DNA binding protein